MEESILTSTKKILGLDEGYTAFDLDVITHINASFSVVTQLGVGPTVGFMIEDATAVWADLDLSLQQLNLVKTYVYLKTKVLFDPPATSFHTNAAENQIKEHEWRLNNMREVEVAVNLPDPIIPVFDEDDEDVDTDPPDPDPGPTLDDPQNVLMDVSPNHIEVIFDEVLNAEFYTLWWRVFPSGDWLSDTQTAQSGTNIIAFDSEVDVQYEVYVQATATGYNAATSEHQLVTGIGDPLPQLDPPSNFVVEALSNEFSVSWDPAANSWYTQIYWRMVGTETWFTPGPLEAGPWTHESVQGIEYEVYAESLQDDEVWLRGETEILTFTGIDFPDLAAPINAAVTPFNDGDSKMTISWEDTPNVEFVLIWFKVVGEPDFDVNGWGIDQLSVTQMAEVGVDYEYYLQSTADGYDPAESEHFFVTGI